MSRRVGLPVAASILLVAGMGMAAWTPSEHAEQSPVYQLQGEYGLAVADLNDSIVVRWITQEEDSGQLRALAGTQQVFAVRTPLGRAHRAAFRRPAGKLLSLIYGSVHNAADCDTTVVSLDVPARPPAVINRVDSVYVVGDVHGKFASLTQLLTQVGVVDQGLHWKAGHARLVFAGDLIDRGEDATRVLWLVYALDREARAAGGAVDVVLGNHEIMEWVGDRRYLAPKESLLAEYHHTCYACLYDQRSSILGRWLASKPGIVHINDVVYVHGGITPGYARMGVNGFNDALFRYLREPVFPHLLEDSAMAERFGADLYHRRLSFFFAPDSPFWFRGYVQTDTLARQLDSVLAAYGARAQVVGHTPVSEILPMYGGKLMPVNVADFATQLLLFTYRKDGKRRAYRMGLRVDTESW